MIQPQNPPHDPDRQDSVDGGWSLLEDPVTVYDGRTVTLEEAVARARRHAEAGDLAAVVAELNGPLTGLAPAVPCPAAIDAGALFAYALAGTGRLGPAVRWATWVRQASQHRYPYAAHAWAADAGATSPRTVDTRAVWPAQVTAQVLARTGNTVAAVTAYQDLVGMLTATDGAAGLRTLCARADLATTAHRAGECLAAHATMTEAWTLLRTDRGDRDPIAVRMCARLATMYRDCADPAEAERHLAQAGRHGAHHPDTSAIVARAARRPADPAHLAVCTHVPGPDGIHRPGLR